MKYYLVFLITALLLIITACKNEKNEKIDFEAPEAENLQKDLPEILKDLPMKIEVRNEPEQVKAIIDPKDSTVFIWKLKTYVKSLSDDITVIEFGDYVKDENGEWNIHNYTGKPFKNKEFSEWYFLSKDDQFTWKNAKGGILKEGKLYVDPVNWTERTDSMRAQSGIWYFIGIDGSGIKVCGYDTYENLPELITSK